MARGSFAACGRRVSFWMPRKKPKRPLGAVQMDPSCPYSRPPLDPHFTGAPIRQAWQLSQRRGWTGNWLPFYPRCRCVSGNLWGALLLDGIAPLGLVGLKCGSGGRRILRRFPISVGAAHWAARGFRALHMFLQPRRGDPRGRPSEPYRFSTNFPGLGRGGPWASRWGVCIPRKHPHPSGLRPDTFPL